MVNETEVKKEEEKSIEFSNDKTNKIKDLLKEYKYYKKDIKFKPNLSIIEISDNLILVNDIAAYCSVKDIEFIKEDIDFLNLIDINKVFENLSYYNSSSIGKPIYRLRLAALITPHFQDILKLINQYESAFLLYSKKIKEDVAGYAAATAEQDKQEFLEGEEVVKTDESETETEPEEETENGEYLQ